MHWEVGKSFILLALTAGFLKYAGGGLGSASLCRDDPPNPREAMIPTSDAPRGFVLFEKDEQTFRADLDGSGARPLRFAGRVATSADGEWFAFRVAGDGGARMFVSRSDGSDLFVVDGQGLGDAGYGPVFVSDPAAAVFAAGGATEQRLWLVALDGSEATAIGEPNIYLPRVPYTYLPRTEEGSVLIYAKWEGIMGRLDLHSGAQYEFGHLNRRDRLLSTAVTRTGDWAAYAWSTKTRPFSGGWVAMDSRGALAAGQQLVRWLLTPGSGSDLVAVGRSSIATLAPPAQPRTIYEAPQGSTIVRAIPVPGTRSVLFTELSPESSSPLDTARGDLIELDLDRGTIRNLGNKNDLHVAEFVSSDGRFILEGVFHAPCPDSYSIPSNRMWGRIATLVRDRSTGDTRLLSADPEVNPLGFSSDGRAAILALPKWTEADPKARHLRRYRIAAHLIDEDRIVDVVDYDVGVAHVDSEQWGLRVVPPPHGRAIYPEDLFGSCPR